MRYPLPTNVRHVVCVPLACEKDKLRISGTTKMLATYFHHQEYFTTSGLSSLDLGNALRKRIPPHGQLETEKSHGSITKEPNNDFALLADSLQVHFRGGMIHQGDLLYQNTAPI